VILEILRVVNVKNLVVWDVVPIDLSRNLSLFQGNVLCPSCCIGG
jgi:hypothetical protein